jgi:hypothetical protein
VWFRHFIITRFNTRIADSTRGLDPDWLGHRLTVFEDLCGPSVARQTVREFEWLLFFDNRTGDAVKGRVSDLARRLRFDPVWLDGEFSAGVAGEAVLARLSGQTHVVTTRLDNDDAIHPDFIRRVQAEIAHRPAYVNFPLGCQLAGGEFYLRPYLGGPFLSRIEPAAARIGTVYEARHWRPEEHRPRQLWTRQPAWLQLVHGHNLANETRGIWTRPEQMVQLFQVPPLYVGSAHVSRLGAAARRVRSVSTLAPTEDLRRRASAVAAMFKR